MNLRVIFLGTAGSVPTLKRGLPAVLVQRKGEHIMFDCGEGVQRQMIIAKTGVGRKMKIFISHMHGDHLMGIPGLLQTMSLLERERKLDIYGPPRIKRFLEAIMETVQFAITFPVEIHEMKKNGVICEEKEYLIEAVKSNHVVTSFAFAFVEKPRPGRFHPEQAKALGVPEGPSWSKLQHRQKIKLPDGRIISPEEVVGPVRPGRKIVYTGDTRPFRGLAKFAAGADLLIHDATFADDLAEKAQEDGHSTPSQAADDARKAKAKQLVLTHISARYDDTSLLLEQAKRLFKNTKVAEDFMKIEIPLSSS